MKNRYSVLPVSLYDLSGVEGWLGEESAKGWHLSDLARGFVHFKRGEAVRLSYRVEPSAGKRAPDEEQKELYRGFGWAFVCATPKCDFSIWRSEETEPRELHTDPAMEAELLEEIYGRWWKTIPLCAILMILAVGMGSFAIWGHPQPLLYGVRNNLLPLLFVLLTNVLLVWQMIRDSCAALRLVRDMKAGTPRPHKRRLRVFSRYFQQGILSLATVGLLLNIPALVWSWTDSKENLVDYAGQLPVVALATLENDSDFEPRPLYTQEESVDWNNFVSVEPSLMTTATVELRQEGRVPGRAWNDGSGTYSPSLSADYYQLRLGFLAKPLLGDLLEKNMDSFYLHDGITVTELRNSPFDQAYFLEQEQRQILLARVGGRVMEMRYYGYADLSVHWAEIARRMAAFTPAE